MIIFEINKGDIENLSHNFEINNTRKTKENMCIAKFDVKTLLILYAIQIIVVIN